MKTVNKGIINHIEIWYSIILEKFNVPVKKIKIKIAELNINSYEIMADVDRKDPKKAYLELALQPENKIP
jgi:hypothetical protein